MELKHDNQRTMPTVEFKNGEIREVADDQMRAFLDQNKHLIRERQSPRRRPMLGDTSVAEVSISKQR